MADNNSKDNEFTPEFLSNARIARFNYQQKVLFCEFWNDLIEWLRTEGKAPEKDIGYSESNLPPLARRIYQFSDYAWEDNRLVLEFDPEIGNRFVQDLADDTITKANGKPYAQGSKRKFTQACQAYFDYIGQDWEPPVSFSDGEPSMNSDPFNQRERELLLNASFKYRSPPSYTNLSPDERDRWKAYLAQYLGKPKSEITRADWDRLTRSWKIPSLIAVSLDGGPRAALIERLGVSHLDLDNGQIIVPGDIAVKNDRKWKYTLTKRSVKLLRKWLDQRSNIAKYDSGDSIWLNRQGNPYRSKNLNPLLTDLVDIADIDADGRKLTWHSIRHSTGMYVYDRTSDLGRVAATLRQMSLEAARKYAHPTPEAQRDMLESIQGGNTIAPDREF